MKGLMKKERAPGLWMEDVPMPTVGDQEVLIKTRKTSICGTDVHIYKWDAWAQKTIPVPMVVGHEFMGEVAAFGKNVTGLKVGDRVCGEGHIVCGHCPNCRMGRKHVCMNTKGLGVNRPGCFAEYFTIPAENVFKLPATIPDNLAAIFDPYGNAVHTALSFDLVGEDVLITGAGPIGIMAAAVARKAGARSVVITDLNEYRLDLAKKMGATQAVNIQKESLDAVMKSIGLEYGFTVGLEMSGHPNGLSTLLEKVQHGGKIALLGILPPQTTIDWDLVIFKMLTLKGIYGREIFSTWYKMVHLLESGLDLAPIITHQFAVDDFEKGFEVMLSGQSGKVILNWD
ncbi:L-threonine 3-dehydrogenase [Candidatus Protochlamydia phocaeensis]|uniref:L-threonine 3-dehydrogenase n=1 Tax=Candidatus Protochlamydia phocaeensis TaxID=1414722 RepID=UPI000837E228|nr:L-threonine 3-dehydrogenase [Candidatus Protochlamydia phocaeensis]